MPKIREYNSIYRVAFFFSCVSFGLLLSFHVYLLRVLGTKSRATTLCFQTPIVVQYSSLRNKNPELFPSEAKTQSDNASLPLTQSLGHQFTFIMQYLKKTISTFNSQNAKKPVDLIQLYNIISCDFFLNLCIMVPTLRCIILNNLSITQLSYTRLEIQYFRENLLPRERMHVEICS